MLDILKQTSTMVGEYLILPALIGIGIGIYKFIKSWIIRQKLFHSVTWNNEKNITINQILSEFLVTSNASRVYLSMFHNGDKYIDGSPIIKFTRISEVCAPGISHETQYYKDVPASFITEIIKELEKDAPEIIVVEGMDASSYKMKLINEGVVYTMVCPVVINKSIVGMVGLDFITNDVPCVTKSDADHYLFRLSEVLRRKK